jgi:hypothetical protein
MVTYRIRTDRTRFDRMCTQKYERGESMAYKHLRTGFAPRRRVLLRRNTVVNR